MGAKWTLPKGIPAIQILDVVRSIYPLLHFSADDNYLYAEEAVLHNVVNDVAGIIKGVSWMYHNWASC